MQNIHQIPLNLKNEFCLSDEVFSNKVFVSIVLTSFDFKLISTRYNLKQVRAVHLNFFEEKYSE